jgi:hypothetical protein
MESSLMALSFEDAVKSAGAKEHLRVEQFGGGQHIKPTPGAIHTASSPKPSSGMKAAGKHASGVYAGKREAGPTDSEKTGYSSSGAKHRASYNVDNDIKTNARGVKYNETPATFGGAKHVKTDHNPKHAVPRETNPQTQMRNQKTAEESDTTRKNLHAAVRHAGIGHGSKGHSGENARMLEGLGRSHG